jgi:tetratricopeptide (TPR) repeat protein
MMATESLDSSELNQLIQNIDNAVAQLQASELGSAYGYFSTKFYERFRVEKSHQHLRWLDLATEYGEKALQHTPPGDFNLAIRLDRQSSMLQDKYVLLGDDQNLGLVLKAAELGRQAVNVPTKTVEDRLDRVDFCGNLGGVLLTLYQREPDPSLLDEAARYAEEAVLGATGVSKANHLNTLANILFEKGSTVTSPETLGLASKTIQQALVLDSSRSALWHTSAIIREQLYICGSSSKDECLNAALGDALKAVELTERRVQTGEETRATQVTCVNHLSSLLAQRYRRYGDLEDLRKAVELGRSVFTDLKSNVPQFLRASQVLTNALAQLYEREGRIEHLNESIKISEEVMNGPSFRAGRVDQAMHFNNLALRSLAHYQHTNAPKSIESAIKYSMDAIRLSNGPMDRARFSVSLAGAYSARSEVLGSVSDIDEAIRILTSEVESLPPDDKWRALDFLSSALSQKFRKVEAKTGDGHALLDSAILHREAVLGQLPDNHPLKSDLLLRYSYLQGISHSVSTNNNPKSLQEALSKAKEALVSLPPYHASLPNILRQIGEMYGLQYELNRNTDDLTEALRSTEDAQKLMDETYAYYASTMNTYGTLLVYQWTTTEPLDNTYLHRAAEAFLKGLRNPESLPTERIRAGKAAGWVFATVSQWNEAADTFQETVLLATKLAPRRLGRVDQQFYLKQ